MASATSGVLCVHSPCCFGQFVIPARLCTVSLNPWSRVRPEYLAEIPSPRPHPNFEDPFYYYPPYYAWVFQVVSFSQKSPPQSCTNLSCHPNIPHAPPPLPIHFILLEFINWIIQGYWKWMSWFNNLSYTVQSRCNPMSRMRFMFLLFPELKVWIRTAIETITADMLQTVWNELDYRVDVCRITKGAHIEHP